MSVDPDTSPTPPIFSAAIRALLSSIERETVAFENRTDNVPFIPKNTEGVAEAFDSHSSHIDEVVFPELTRSDVRHVCYMTAEGEPGTWHAVQYDRIGNQPSHFYTETLKADALAAFVRPLLERGLVPDLGRQKLESPKVVNAHSLTLIGYLVSPTFPHLRVARLNEADSDDANDATLLCDVIVIPWFKGKTERLKPIECLEAVRRDIRPVFEAYHLVWTDQVDSATHGTKEILEVIRSLTLQFQREWAARDEERTKITRERQATSIALAHEFSNSLKELNWQFRLELLRQWKPRREDAAIRRQMMACLSRMVWPESLAEALRAFSDAMYESGRLRKDFIDSTACEQGTYHTDRPHWTTSVEYLVRYVAASLKPDDQDGIIETLFLDLKQDGADTTEAPHNIVPLAEDEVFDAARLVLPPFARTQRGRLLGACFVLEPLRNAIRYLRKSRMCGATISCHLASKDEHLEVRISNPCQPDAMDEVVKSLTILRTVGEATGVASVYGPTFDRKAQLCSVTIEMHARRVKDKL